MSKGIDPRLAKRRSAVAVATRAQNPAAIESTRRDLAAEKIAVYIERIAAAAPPLTLAQRDKLALLLRGGSVGDAAEAALTDLGEAS